MTSTTASTALKSGRSCVSICIASHAGSVAFFRDEKFPHNHMNSPISLSGPKSVLAITRTLKSFCTLPMISTAWLSWRCESWSKKHVSTSGRVMIFPCVQTLFSPVMTYAVQEDADLATGIDSRLLATQLADFAKNADCLVRELLEEGSGNARRCFRHDGCLLCVL